MDFQTLNNVFFLLDESMASIMCRRFGALSSIFIGGVSRNNNITPVILSAYTAYEDGTGSSETLAQNTEAGETPKRKNTKFFTCSSS
jgi:hypothetical protein